MFVWFHGSSYVVWQQRGVAHDVSGVLLTLKASSHWHSCLPTQEHTHTRTFVQASLLGVQHSFFRFGRFLECSVFSVIKVAVPRRWWCAAAPALSHKYCLLVSARPNNSQRHNITVATVLQMKTTAMMVHPCLFWMSLPTSPYPSSHSQYPLNSTSLHLEPPSFRFNPVPLPSHHVSFSSSPFLPPTHIILHHNSNYLQKQTLNHLIPPHVTIDSNPFLFFISNIWRNSGFLNA